MPEVKSAEIILDVKHGWVKFGLSTKEEEEILQIRFIKRVSGSKLFFEKGHQVADVKKEFESALKRIINKKAHIKYHCKSDPPAEFINRNISDPIIFKTIAFGSDVAEHDEHLLEYFISTDTYKKTLTREKNLIIGPKGSGKSAILKALSSHPDTGYSIEVTPEVFATSMLRQFVENQNSTQEDEEAFVSTWIFTLLFEVFKRVCDNPRGIPNKSLKPIRTFVAENSAYQDVDLFTRFITYLKRIEALKLGNYEITLKTKKLQELYALEGLYELIPGLRDALKEDILILIDELDQGWDNTPHANRFIASLLKAATRIQRLGIRVHVVVFIRSEIFDLVKYELDQLDKIRSNIENIKWKNSDLAFLLVKRIAYCFNIPIDSLDISILKTLLPQSCIGMSGIDYLISRTNRRPREVLQFVRQAHDFAVESGKNSIDSDAIIKAEEDFSAWKLEHLCSEYKYIYPKLSDLLWSFRGQGPILGSGDVSDIVSQYIKSVDMEAIPEWAKQSTKEIIQILYSIEFLGAERPSSARKKTGILKQFEFAYERPSANVKSVTCFMIHPSVWSELEIAAVGP